MAMKRYKILVPEFIAILEQNGFEKLDDEDYPTQYTAFIKTPGGNVIALPMPDDIGYILEALLIDVIATHGLPSIPRTLLLEE